MVFCIHCGSAATGSFCVTCGKEIPKSNDKEFYKGTLRSSDGEEWKYEGAELTCVEGNPKGSCYTWNGTTFVSSKNNSPKGTWNGSNTVTWRFPNDSEDFYVFSFDPSKKRWNCDSGFKRTVPNLRISYAHWIVNNGTIQLEEGSDFKEGASTKWDVLGDMPTIHPVALMIAMFSRAQKLLDENIERSKRVYKRCGKLVLTSAGPTLLCASCANSSSDRCIACDAECSGNKFPGKICKTCSPRKNFCIKCSDPLFGSKKEGYLCPSCGLGKTSDNCAKLVFSIQ